jgi:LysR family glycine cleavage system transcriptional activator
MIHSWFSPARLFVGSVSSSYLLKQCGPAANIDALLGLPLLHDSITNGDGSDSDWRTARPSRQARCRCRAGQHISEGGTLIDAAVLGLGIALARASLITDQLASGALVCPLRLTGPTAFTYYLLGLPEAVERSKIAVFRKLLVAEAAATEAFMLSIGEPMDCPVADAAAAPAGA